MPRFSYHLVLVPCVAVLLFVQITSLDGIASLSAIDGTSSPFTPARRRPKLGDGCRHVFLDVGANVGIHTRFLYEPDLYPDSRSSVAAFDREFGARPRDNRDYCAFSFEPNPKFERRHADLAKGYADVGWRYFPIMAGAGDADGNLTFYHSHFEKEEWETGFSAVTPKTLYGNNATARTVQIVRLAAWIMDEIQDRIVPDAASSEHADSEPTVVMKLDIEGLEFRVFPDLLTTRGVVQQHSLPHERVSPLSGQSQLLSHYADERREARAEPPKGG